MPATTEHPQPLKSRAQLEFLRRAPNGGLRALAVVAAAVVLTCQLLVPPIVGMADNGDFSKLLGRYGLTNPAYYQYIGIHYPFDADSYYDAGFSSSEQIFIRSALTIEGALGEIGGLDLRVAGVVHSAVFLLAVALFVPLLAGAPWVFQVACCGAALFIFTDVMYVSYFNSFYMDVSALLMLLLGTVSYLRAIRWRRRADIVLFVVSSLILITSKPQHAMAGVWIAGLAWVAREPLWRGRKPVAAGCAVLMLLTAGATFRFAAPPEYSANNCFNIVFFGILPHSHDVNRTLTDLGLDARDRVSIGTTAYTAGTRMRDPAFSRVFSKKISYPKLAGFYLTHPLDAWREMHIGLAMAGRERERLGNFTGEAGEPPMSESRSFAAWSDLKRLLYDEHGLRLLVSFAGLAALVMGFLVKQRRAPGVMAGAVVLIGTAATEMLIACMGDALDVTRHHLIFLAEFDMLILAVLWLGFDRLRARRAKGRI